MNHKHLILGLCLATGTILSQAKVSLPAYFSDNMIVQQKSDLTIPGESSTGNEITIKASWSSKEYKATPAANGKFSAQIPTPKAGGPYTISIDDGDPLTLQNVMVGEVWLCSGQSNMEMPMAGWGRVMNFEQEIKDANYPDIRLLQVRKVTSHRPSDKLVINGDGWKECAPASVENFSSVAYFYARALWKKLKVPVGVIDCSWGGTPAEAWTSIPALKQVIGFEEDAAGIEQCHADRDLLFAKYHNDMKNWESALNAVDPGMRDNQPYWARSEQLGEEWKAMNLPGVWEQNGLPGFDGSVWFQKTIEIPAEWAGKPIQLVLGKIDDKDITYFNGVEIARGEGYSNLRDYTVPAKLVNAGKAIVTIKVQDTSGDGGVWGSHEELFMASGDHKITLTGAWRYRVGVHLSKQPQVPFSPDSQNYPGVLYNAMIYPLRHFPIKGAIWYQGEANVERATQYTSLFQTMITDWRNLWNNNFPFYFVQLANFLPPQEVQPQSTWAHLREAQEDALKLENTGMAVSIDIGETYDIHPKNKQEVGARLARAALAHTYGKGKYVIPMYQDFQVKGKTIVVSFNQKLHIKGERPTGFAIAGPDMKFHPAQAAIQGNTITLTSPHVSVPIAARYGWADNPPCNIYGDDELPLAPFRTDRFE